MSERERVLRDSEQMSTLSCNYIAQYKDNQVNCEIIVSCGH